MIIFCVCHIIYIGLSNEILKTYFHNRQYIGNSISTQQRRKLVQRGSVISLELQQVWDWSLCHLNSKVTPFPFYSYIFLLTEHLLYVRHKSRCFFGKVSLILTNTLQGRSFEFCVVNDEAVQSLSKWPAIKVSKPRSVTTSEASLIAIFSGYLYDIIQKVLKTILYNFLFPICLLQGS